MKYLWCLLSSLLFISVKADDSKFELNPTLKPFPGLVKGKKEDVLPQAYDGAQGRISGGLYASKQQIPYQVGLLVSFGNSEYAWCGGILIAHEWVLTVAHCVAGAKTIEVRLGGIYSDHPLRTTWAYQNIVHDGWTTDGDDIALIKIPWVEYDANIDAATLPKRNGVYSQYIFSQAVASGWGSINDGLSSNELKYAKMTVVDNEICARLYGPSSRRASVLCARGNGFGVPCSGDAGGPLVIDNTRQLIGIINFGSINGCVSALPAAFVRITYYLDWIQRTTGLFW